MPTIYSDSGGMGAVGPMAIGRVAKIATLTRMKAAAGPLFGAEISLYTNSATPGPLSVEADFTAPEWTLYAPIAIVWGTAAGEGSTGAVMAAASVNWISAANADTLVYGWVVLGEDGDYIYGRRLEEPVPIVGVMSITVVPAIVFA